MEGDIGGEVPCSSMAVDSVLRIGWLNLGFLYGITRSYQIRSNWQCSCIFLGLFAAIFSFTRCGVQRYRRQNDWVNALVGGAVAGAAIGAGTRNWKQVAGVSGLICALYHVADDAKSF